MWIFLNLFFFRVFFIEKFKFSSQEASAINRYIVVDLMSKCATAVCLWVCVSLGSDHVGGSWGSAVAGGDLHLSGQIDFTWPKE